MTDVLFYVVINKDSSISFEEMHSIKYKLTNVRHILKEEGLFELTHKLPLHAVSDRYFKLSRDIP